MQNNPKFYNFMLYISQLYTDTPQKDWDKKISTFLLNSKVQKGKGRRESSRAIDTQEKSTGILNESDLEWNLSTLRSYVMLVCNCCY